MKPSQVVVQNQPLLRSAVSKVEPEKPASALNQKFASQKFRHPEIVSGSISHIAPKLGWAASPRVQHDEDDIENELLVQDTRTLLDSR